MSRTDTPTAPAEPHHTGRFATTGAFVTSTRYSKFARRALSLALSAHAAFAAVFMALGVSLMVWVNLGSIAVYLTCIVLARQHRNSWVSWLVVLELLGHAAIATRVVGWASGFQFYAWLIIPLVAMNTRSNIGKKVTVVVLTSLACLGMDLWLQGVAPLTVLSANTILFLHAYNLGSYLTIMAVLAFVYAQTVAEAEQGLHRHATTDALTGLRNRRRMMELIRDELARARRATTPVSIIVADIDNFKNVNDRYGHPTGDQVLINVAHCLRNCVRRQDHVARWGGEEFLIVLPDIDLQGAYAAAERMRQSIEQAYVTVGEAVRCTASFGVSEWKSRHGETFEQCLGRADAALYSAKQFGRNHVSLSQSPELSEHRVAEVLSANVTTTDNQTATASPNLTQAVPSHRSTG